MSPDFASLYPGYELELAISVEFGKFAPSNGKLSSVTINVSLLHTMTWEVSGTQAIINNAEYVDYGAEQTLSFYVLGRLPSSVAQILCVC